MASNQDILFTFQGVDNVSPTVQQIDRVIGGTMGSATTQTGGFINSMRELGGIFQGINGLVMGFFGTMGLSTFKNMTYGTATAREQIYQLFQTTAGTSQEADNLWNKMDDLTNHGYVSLDQLGQAVNILGMSVGASVPQMDTMVTLINEVGNRAILMGYDANRTQNLMNSAATGLNGNLDMLNNAFGITKKKLMDLGWKGTSDDVEGYTRALKEYLGINDEANEHLDNTQGKVIALQKRFRIAGRKLGNYMLPPINAIMDAFTQLNAESNDLLATLVIVGTGAMSGFASILPTLSPLLQLYDFIGKRSLNFNISGLGSLIQTRTVTGRLLANTKDLIASPIAGWIRYWTRSNLLPYLDRVWISMRRLYLTNITYTDTFSKITGVTNTVTNRFLSGLGRISRAIGNAQINLAKFVATYGSLEGRVNVLGRIANHSDRLEQLGATMKEWSSPISFESMRSQGFQLPKVNLENVRSQGFMSHVKDTAILNQLDQETKALQRNRIEQEKNRLARQRNILATIKNALGLGTDTTRTVANTFAKEFNVGMTLAERTAKADANKQQAITNLLKLEEMGIIQKDNLYMALYNMGLLSEAETRVLLTDATLMEEGAKGGLFGINTALAGINMVLLAQILLIVGAVLLVIAVIDQIGKTLGWWKDWRTMLDAIVAGLNRIWQAFINNPNVQGFIKDLQWIFGQLGGAISEVAWQILEFFGWENDGSEFDIVRTIIDIFGALGDIMGKVVNGIKWLESEFHIFSAIADGIALPIRVIVWLLRTVICALVGCSPGIIPALRQVFAVFRQVWGGLSAFIKNPIGTILNVLKSLTTRFFSIARNMGLMLWNGLNSVLGGLPQKVWNVFWTMINNLKKIPQMIWGTAQQIGQSAYDGLDNVVSTATLGQYHLPGSTADKKKQAMKSAKTMGNATKNYNNTHKVRGGHTINVGKGAIQLDARNLTTKESKQIMINALEGLTTYETVHTKKAQGQK